MFLMLDHTYFMSYAVENTLCIVNENVQEVIRTFKQISKPLLKSFKDNKMKLNPDKCCWVMSDKENRGLNVGKVVIKNLENKC